MNDIRFDTVYPSVPESTHLRLEKALEEKTNVNTKKIIRPATVLVIALLLMLLLGGAAYAASQSGILRYLLGGADAPDGLKSIVQPAEYTAAEDHIRVELTGLVFNGERLALAFSVENQKPDDLAMVTLDAVYLEGDWMGMEFGSFDSQWVPDVFRIDVAGADRNPVIGGCVTSAAEKEYTGILHGEAVFTVQRPEGPVVVCDPWMWYDYDRVFSGGEDGDTKSRTEYSFRREQIQNAGLTVAHPFRMDARSWYLEGYTVVDADGEMLMLWDEASHPMLPEEFGGHLACHQTTLYPTQMKQTAELRIPFTLDADAAKQNRVDVQAEFALPDCRVKVEKCVLTPLSTLIELRLYPTQNTQEAALALAERYGYPALLDEKGGLIEFLDMEGGGSWNGISQDEDGQSYTVLEYSWGGMKEIPRELHFAFDRDEFPYQLPARPDPEANRLFSETVVIPLR